MNTHIDKTQDNKSQSVANPVAQKQGGNESIFQFVDNRAEAVAQRTLQAMANNSLKIKQLKDFQEIANNSSQAKKSAQLETMANNYSARQHQPIQKKKNNTGLPDSLKSGIENLSGYSLEGVKVHYNSDMPAQLQAHAYAQGTDIHLASHGNPVQRIVSVGNPSIGEAVTTVREPGQIPTQWLAGLDRIRRARLYTRVQEINREYNFVSIAALHNDLGNPDLPAADTSVVRATAASSHGTQPYAVDALHELGPIMGPMMDKSKGMLSRFAAAAMGMASPSRILSVAQQLDVTITGAIELKNPTLEERYANALELIRAKNGGAPPTERELYSGHSNLVKRMIMQQGHHPSFNSDEGSKGYGALGLGAYFTDQVDKAISYAAGGLRQGEEGSVLLQRIILGNMKFVRDAHEFRHSAHNRMVNPAMWGDTTKAPFKVSKDNPGISEWDNAPDSLRSIPTAEPGRGLIGITMDMGATFDSSEFMVRNPDQVLPIFEIFFRKN